MKFAAPDLNPFFSLFTSTSRACKRPPFMHTRQCVNTVESIILYVELNIAAFFAIYLKRKPNLIENSSYVFEK